MELTQNKERGVSLFLLMIIFHINVFFVFNETKYGNVTYYNY